MILGLIGMSGIGKTAWAGRLAAAGFECRACDDLIAERLCARFPIASPALAAVGAWMGLPFEPGYAAREAAYLAEEGAVLDAIAHELAHGSALARQLVIDLTGSAVYVAPATLAALRRAATIVYLAADPQHHQRLLRAYLDQPRPVIWNGLYQPEPGEPPEAAVARCYPRLLAEREARYAALCDVQLDAAVHLDPALTVGELVQLIEDRQGKI